MMGAPYYMDSFGILGFLGTFAGLLMLPLFFLFLALVLYYFTGEKKRADEFMPHLMTVGFRSFGYTLILGFSLVAFASLNSALGLIFRSFDGSRLQTESLLSSVGVLILAIALIYAMRRLVNTAQNMTKNFGSVSTKLFLLIGLSTYSIFFVVSIFQFVSIFLSGIISSASVLDGQNVALLLSSMLFVGTIFFRIWKVLVKESKSHA
jgi:hypothetical protein